MTAPPSEPGALTRGDLRLVPTACVLWVLATVGTVEGVRAAIIVLALVLVGALIPAAITRYRDAAGLVVAHALLLLIGSMVLLPSVQRVDAAHGALREAAEGRLVLTAPVRLLEEPSSPDSGPPWSRTGVRGMAVIPTGTVRIGREVHRLPARTRVLLTGADTPQAVGDPCMGEATTGDALTVSGTVAVEGTLVVVRVQRVHEIAPARGIRADLRRSARTTTARLPPDEAALSRGMTTGDTTGLSEAGEEGMRGAGLSHLVAVSGANIALVLGAVLMPLLLLGVRRRPRLLAAALVGAGYASLVGDQPSVLRAGTMAVPVLAARWAGVRASPISALAATIAVWSTLSPADAASIGFVLSALATGAILVLAPPAARAISSMCRGRMGERAALVIAVPLVAQLACTPVLILLSPEVSVWTVAANIAVAPLIGPATVVGLVAVAIGPLAPGVSEALWIVPAGAAHLVLIVARSASHLPGAHIRVPDGGSGALLALGVVVLLIAATAARRHRAVRWATAVVAVAVLAPPLARCSPWHPGAGDGWTIAACAIGQGDATVLRGSPTGPDPAVVLVDTGPDPAALTDCLDRLGITQIDLLVLTHPHADHVDGIAALTGSRIPRAQWICPSEDAARTVASGPAARPVVRGESAPLSGLELEVLWPVSAEGVRRVAARETSEEDQGGANDCSVVIAATWDDGARLVALGDLEPIAQGELAALDPGPAEVVKVAHHGSRRQDPELYARLSPELALLEVGEGNTFGHPAPATLTMLDLLGAVTLRTDRDGTLVLTSPRDEGAQPAAWDASDARSVGPPR